MGDRAPSLFGRLQPVAFLKLDFGVCDEAAAVDVVGFDWGNCGHGSSFAPVRKSAGYSAKSSIAGGCFATRIRILSMAIGSLSHVANRLRAGLGCR